MKNENPEKTVPDNETRSDIETAETARPGRWLRFKLWYRTNKKWSVTLTVLALLIVLGCVPWTRYKAAGLVLKKNFAVQITDATAHIPVSGATVQSGSVKAETNADGWAVLPLKVGPHSFTIDKKYYLARQASLTVPIFKANDPPFMLTATGRQARIHVINLISKKVLAGADIKVAGANAKTDSSGNALVVLPADGQPHKAALSLDGYNDASVNVQVSDSSIKENDFTLTPSGKVYFLSKLSGNIDVVKTNLDGTARQTVLAGTGKEDDTGTVLLASQDWRYLALLSNRDGNDPALYVINTRDDQLLNMDEGDASFNPIGWHDHYFVYTVSRNGYNAWQPNAFSIKSYNAETGQTLTLANTGATGSSDADAEFESILDAYIVGDNVVYSRTWYKYPGYLTVVSKQNVLAAIHPDGTDSRQLKTVDAAASYMSSFRITKPRELDFAVYSSNGSAGPAYYVLDKSGNVSQSSTLSDQDLAKESATYLLSPSGGQTFWQDERDGKNTLFIGDQDAAGAKQIATLSSYSVYGWYTDNYLLVSKNSSELYIMPASGFKNDSQAIKITDYHKPDQSFYGYGGGYGGL